MPKKKKVQKKESKILRSNIRVIDYVHIDVDREATRTEWDADDITEYHRIEGIKVVDKGEYGDISVPFIPEHGKNYFLVCVEYDTGDSFHRERGKMCFVDLYEKYEDARATCDKIYRDMKKYNEKHGLKGADDFSVKIENSSGSKYQFSCPWKGFFESFGGTKIENVNLVG